MYSNCAGGRPRALAAVLAAALMALGGCGKRSGAQDFECTLERAGWAQCRGAQIQYCHIVAGMAPHFHWGQDCGAAGYTCLELGRGEAVCLDMARSCTALEHHCRDNIANNCLAGFMSVTPCGSAKHCHEENGKALCEGGAGECGGHGHLESGRCHCDNGWKEDPHDPANCIEDLP